MADKVFGIEVVEPLDESGDQFVMEDHEIYEVIEDIMHIDPSEDLDGIQIHGPKLKRVDVITKDLKVWDDKDLYEFLDERITLSRAKSRLCPRFSPA